MLAAGASVGVALHKIGEASEAKRFSEEPSRV
jgi:hypothetical protein